MIEDELEEILLPNANDELVKPSIASNYFDPRSYEDYELPGIVVRAIGGEQIEASGAEERSVNIEIIIGLYISEAGDEEYAYSLVDRVYNLLLRQRIIGGTYKLVMPISWSTSPASDQPYPYWYAAISAQYYMPAVTQEINKEI